MDLEYGNALAFKNTFDSDALEAHKALKERIFNKDILDRLSSESLNELTELEDANGSTIFHFISENFCDFHKYFINVCKKKLPEERICGILLKKNLHGRTPFELSPEKHFFCNFIGKRMSRESLDLLVSSFCSEPITPFVDKKLNNFVHHLAKKYYNNDIVVAFMEFCRRGEKLSYLEDALKSRNSFWGDTPLHVLIQNSAYPSVLEAILNAFGGKIFSIQDKWGCNIFHRVSYWSQSRNNYAMEIVLINFYEENISNPEIRQAYVSAMMQGDKTDKPPVFDYIVDRKPRLFLSTCNTLTDDELKKIFLMEDDMGRNIFKHLFYFYFIEPRPDEEKENDQELFDCVLNVCQKHSSWIREIFAEGTELSKTLVLEEKDRCHFARCLRKIMELNKGND